MTDIDDIRKRIYRGQEKLTDAPFAAASKATQEMVLGCVAAESLLEQLTATVVQLSHHNAAAGGNIAALHAATTGARLAFAVAEGTNHPEAKAFVAETLEADGYTLVARDLTANHTGEKIKDAESKLRELGVIIGDLMAAARESSEGVDQAAELANSAINHADNYLMDI